MTSRLDRRNALANPIGLLGTPRRHDNHAPIDAIAEVRGEYTTVIVTHRPATLQIADRVIVMDGGRIVESGTPAQLEAAGGEYARLVTEWRASEAWRVG